MPSLKNSVLIFRSIITTRSNWPRARAVAINADIGDILAEGRLGRSPSVVTLRAREYLASSPSPLEFSYALRSLLFSLASTSDMDQCLIHAPIDVLSSAPGSYVREIFSVLEQYRHSATAHARWTDMLMASALSNPNLTLTPRHERALATWPELIRSRPVWRASHGASRRTMRLLRTISKSAALAIDAHLEAGKSTLTYDMVEQIDLASLAFAEDLSDLIRHATPQSPMPLSVPLWPNASAVMPIAIKKCTLPERSNLLLVALASNPVEYAPMALAHMKVIPTLYATTLLTRLLLDRLAPQSRLEWLFSITPSTYYAPIYASTTLWADVIPLAGKLTSAQVSTLLSSHAKTPFMRPLAIPLLETWRRNRIAATPVAPQPASTPEAEPPSPPARRNINIVM